MAIENLRTQIERLANIQIEALDEPTDRGRFVLVQTAAAEVFLPMTALLDLDAERARLSKRLVAVEAETEQRSTKLANRGFLAKAPEAVVAKERERLVALHEESATLRDQLELLG